MSKHQEYEKKTEQLILPVLEKYQYELVDVEFVKEAGSWHLRAYIDKPGGITIDDLTVVNHELSDLLDENDLRPFRKPKDFQRNLGKDVEMKLFSPVTWEEKGKKYSDKEFIGVLKGYDEESAEVTIGFEDREMRVQVKDIALIRQYVTF